MYKSIRLIVASFVAAVVSVLSMAADNSNSTAQIQENLVRDYVAAFNARDIDTMLAMVTEDVQWITEEGDRIITELDNKAALGNSMEEYFRTCPSCKSRLSQLFSSGERVTALEVASFESGSEVKEQQSFSLYEFSGSLIKRVYYFPAESVP